MLSLVRQDEQPRLMSLGPGTALAGFCMLAGFANVLWVLISSLNVFLEIQTL